MTYQWGGQARPEVGAKQQSICNPFISLVYCNFQDDDDNYEEEEEKEDEDNVEESDDEESESVRPKRNNGE